jgi:hypothetical protein
MKIKKDGIISALFLFLISLTPSFAIDGLHISVPSSNAVLSWASLSNETYVVEYRGTMSATDMWTTLSGNLVAATGANITSFTDPNTINYGIPSGYSGTNSGGNISPGTNNMSGGTVTNGTPGSGFYRVLDVRVTNGLTNGMTASGYINVTVRPESGANYLALQANGQSLSN